MQTGMQQQVKSSPLQLPPLKNRPSLLTSSAKKSSNPSPIRQVAKKPSTLPNNILPDSANTTAALPNNNQHP
jgi:hypothetical protein